MIRRWFGDLLARVRQASDDRRMFRRVMDGHDAAVRAERDRTDAAETWRQARKGRHL